MSHSGVVMSISCNAKKVLVNIGPPPSVLRVSFRGVGSIVEVAGIVLLGVTSGLPVV